MFRRSIRTGLVLAFVLGLILGLSAGVASAARPQSPPGEVEDEAPLASGARALQAEDAAAARGAFEAAVEAEPDNPAAWLGLAGAAELMEDWPSAIGAARRAAALAPERPEPHLALARALGRAGRVEEALAAFARVRELDPDDEEGYLLAAVLARDAGDAERAARLLSEGHERLATPRLAEQLTFLLLAQGQPDDALAMVERALADAPARGSLLLAKALALAARSEDREAALPWFARALEAGVANEGAARLEWARLLGDLERWPEAARQLRRVTAAMPEHPEAYFRLGTALRQLGDGEAAAAALTRYQELEAARVAAERRVRELGTALNEAQELANANDLEGALARLDGIAGGGADARVWMLRAKVLFSLDRRQEALEAIRRATQLAPLDLEPAYLRAAFAFALPEYPEALEQVERALVLEPRLGDAWALRGSTLARMGRVEEAALSFERALDLGFDSARLRLEYAGVLSDLGRDEESREQLEARERLTEGTGGR